MVGIRQRGYQCDVRRAEVNEGSRSDWWGLTKTGERVDDSGTKAVHERGLLAVVAHQPYPDAVGLGLASPIHYQLTINALAQQWVVYVGSAASRLSLNSVW